MKIDNELLLPILKNVTIFAGLSDDNLRQITNECQILEYAENATIIRENTPGKELLVILQGRVKIVLGIDSEPFDVAEFGPGNCLGEVSMIGILNHSASVIALEPTEILVISKQILMDTFKTDKELFSILVLNIARELARRLYRTDQVLLDQNRKHQPQK